MILYKNMEDKKINIGIGEIKKMTMTANEKENILQSILSTQSDTRPVKSP